MVRKGVAFHHASLPDDILADIETAMRGGDLRHIAATTGLIEGVNLPVHSVVITDDGYYGEGDQRTTTIDAADLVNAVGRAGRATKETEGWVVLVNRVADDATFGRLTGAGDWLDVHSTLNSDDVFDALAEFEAHLAHGEDVVFEKSSPAIEEFLSYVWFLADALDRLGHASTIDDITAVLDTSLAWHECDPAARQRWVSATSHALDAYIGADPLTRARWARSGIRIPVARALDRMADELVADIDPTNEPYGAVETLELLVQGDRFERIIALDRRPPVFKPHPIATTEAWSRPCSCRCSDADCYDPSRAGGHALRPHLHRRVGQHDERRRHSHEDRGDDTRHRPDDRAGPARGGGGAARVRQPVPD